MTNQQIYKAVVYVKTGVVLMNAPWGPIYGFSSAPIGTVGCPPGNTGVAGTSGSFGTSLYKTGSIT